MHSKLLRNEQINSPISGNSKGMFLGFHEKRAIHLEMAKPGALHGKTVEALVPKWVSKFKESVPPPPGR